MVRGRRAVVLVVAQLACVGVAGCTDGGPAPPSESSSPTLTSTETPEPTEPPTETISCFRDVRPVPIPPDLRELPFPDRTTVYDVEERGDAGVVLTAVSSLSFRVAALQMRSRYLAPPFTIVGSNQSETGFGANWNGRTISGRFEVVDLAPDCPGDTEVQILWTPAGGLAE